jgi:hypothetical protein
MVHLEINKDCYIAFTDRSIGRRWGNCYYKDISEVSLKYLEDKRANTGDLGLYTPIATEPVLFWKGG